MATQQLDTDMDIDMDLDLGLDDPEFLPQEDVKLTVSVLQQVLLSLTLLARGRTIFTK